MLMSTTHRALLIDFGGTLFLGLDGEPWLAAAARKASVELAPGEAARLGALIDSRLRSLRLPGGDLSPAAPAGVAARTRIVGQR